MKQVIQKPAVQKRNFSLRTLLVATLLVAAVTLVYLFSRENEALKKENEAYRAKHGDLNQNIPPSPIPLLKPNSDNSDVLIEGFSLRFSEIDKDGFIEDVEFSGPNGTHKGKSGQIRYSGKWKAWEIRIDELDRGGSATWLFPMKDPE